MGRYRIKPDRDQDFYVEWSTIVDAPIKWGTRAEMAEMLFEDRATLTDTGHPRIVQRIKEEIEQNLQMADELGSDSFAQRGRWGCEPLTLQGGKTSAHGFYKVPRDKLRAFLDTFDLDAQEFDYSELEPDPAWTD